MGAIHEVMEFDTDLRQNSKMQKGLKDTNFDIVFDIIGSVLAAAVVFLMA